MREERGAKRKHLCPPLADRQKNCEGTTHTVRSRILHGHRVQSMVPADQQQHLQQKVSLFEGDAFAPEEAEQLQLLTAKGGIGGGIGWDGDLWWNVRRREERLAPRAPSLSRWFFCYRRRPAFVIRAFLLSVSTHLVIFLRLLSSLGPRVWSGTIECPPLLPLGFACFCCGYTMSIGASRFTSLQPWVAKVEAGAQMYKLLQTF